MFLARHRKLGVKRAIKMIPKNEVNSECYNVEINILKEVNIQGIPIIYDVDEDDCNWYIVEEYIEGISFLSYFKSEDNDVKEVIKYLSDICMILESLHTIRPFGVIYRDLKPENIVICEQGIYLIDFGNCMVMDGEVRKYAMATKEYAAPEQLNNEEPGVWTDVYSIGVLIQKVYKRYQVKMTEYRDDILRIISICMEKNPEQRYTSALVIKNNLNALINENRECDKSNQDIYIYGCRRYAGVTHFALGFSKYFAEESYNAIYMEESSSKQIINLIGYDDRAECTNGIYVYDKCRILPDYGEFFRETDEDYESEKRINIHDCGLCHGDIKDFDGFVIVVITDIKSYHEFMFNDYIFESEEKKVLYVANFSDEKGIKRLLRQRSIDIIKMPYFENPFIMDKGTMEFYSNIAKRIVRKPLHKIETSWRKK